ncbi:hypothetical protein SUGI_0692960 [Cryptomeria japonica]|nr:hypothetical protein SUGI_0692960 [Cryptomeria japonica]
MDGHKKEAVKRTLSRINLTSQQLNTELNKKIEKLGNEIRDFYQDRTIECSGQTFVDIFVKDACFILQYIRSCVGMDASPTDSTNSCFQNYDHHDDFHSSVQSDIWKLDDLIDSENDVAVRKREKIICSKLGSDAEIAVMFNNCICKKITETKYESLEITMRQARKHYNSRLKRWVSEFKKENCSKPWYVVSGVVAALILVMTAVQTVYAVKK